MSFTVFSYDATVLLIQPNPTQSQPNPWMDPTHVHLWYSLWSVGMSARLYGTHWWALQKRQNRSRCCLCVDPWRQGNCDPPWKGHLFGGWGRRIDSIVDDMDRKFLRCRFSQSTVCILYSLQSKAIRTGSALETTTFSPQSATVLVASLLLYVVFFDLHRFLLSLYIFLIASFYFLCMFQCLFYLSYHCYVTAFKSWFACIRLLRVVQL